MPLGPEEGGQVARQGDCLPGPPAGRVVLAVPGRSALPAAAVANAFRLGQKREATAGSLSHNHDAAEPLGSPASPPAWFLCFSLGHSFTPQLAAQRRLCEAVVVLGCQGESLLMAVCAWGPWRAERRPGPLRDCAGEESRLID